jgi:hypothetical protein
MLLGLGLKTSGDVEGLNLNKKERNIPMRNSFHEVLTIFNSLLNFNLLSKWQRLLARRA